MELRDIEESKSAPGTTLSDTEFAETTGPPERNQLFNLARSGPARIRTRMSKSEFHTFLLQNSDLKIERDRHGIVIIHPFMTLKSAYNEGEAFFLLKYWSKTNPLGKAFSPSAAFDLPDGATYKADGAWISMEQLNRLTPEQEDRIAQIVPDFIMEVRSKTDSLPQLKKKMTEAWMANGVRLAWLLDPQHGKAWVYRAGKPAEEVTGPEATLSGEDVLPGFVLSLKDL
jgi:Uma2 family endonuclease